MLKLPFYTGIRNAELSNLEIADVDLNQLRIHIREGKGKKIAIFPFRRDSEANLLTTSTNRLISDLDIYLRQIERINLAHVGFAK